LHKIEGIGEVIAKRIRELATAKYVSATPIEIKKIAVRDSLEKFNTIPLVQSDDDLDIPPPSEE
jgi:hypothetical protein